MTDLFLTPKQVKELTGLVQWAAQIRWLQRNQVHHYVRADGRPIVPREGIRPPSAQARESTGEPDFAALRA